MPPEELSREELLALVAAQSATAATQAELIDGLIARVGERDRRIVAQDTRIAGLSAEVERLRRLLSRNSGNSSLPPSSDGVLPGRAAPSRAERRAPGAKRKRGKQPGEDGTSLAWTHGPDQVRRHLPAGPCGCGTDLAGAEVVGVARSHQVHDVPAVEVSVVQHDLVRVRCGCGAVHVADQPVGVPAAPVSYGPGVRTLATYLLVRHHLPVERVAELVADLTGAAVSTGWVHGLLAGAGAAVAPAVEAIAARIEDADVVGFDETTLRVGTAGQGRYVLSASTDLHALFVLGRRDLASFRAFLLARVSGTVVHDRYSLYYHPEFQFDPETGTGVKDHQACCSHLLRDLEDARQSYPDALWPEQAVTALRNLVHEANTARDTRQAAVPRDVRDRLVGEFRAAVRVGLSEVTPAAKGTKQPPARCLLEFLRDHEADTLRFVDNLGVWPTNNTSERDLRPLKTQQKISGRLTSETVTRHRLAVASYLTTARKHGLNLFTTLRQALAGTPWIPPVAVPT